jgi:LIVCS family branched-chain amino acid:cation transporter
MTAQTKPIPSKKFGFFSVFTTGFALFSMFFGAGNLIFPLIIGRSTGGNWIYALSGLAITAVIVPFLGLAGMIFFQADCRNFLNRIGKTPGFLLLLLLQLILGPLGVIPRLFTLMHAILKPYFLSLPLPLFCLIAALTIFICSFKKQNLIRILGIVLTPILLISLACLFVSGFVYKSATPSFAVSPASSFWQGFLGGYNTMDLIAAFLFATVVLPHFQKETTFITSPEEQKKTIFKKVFFSSLVAASLLLLTYIGICFISCYHAPPESASFPSEAILGVIAYKLLGSTGGFIAAIAIVTACLTTAITLTLIFAEYLQKDLCKEKINSNTALLLTLLVTTGMANLGFKGIASFLGPILEICYPGLIVLTILNILTYFTGFKAVKLPVFLTFGASALLYFI